MAPRLAGVLHGIGDACYSAGGFVVPLMINAMITDDPYLIRLRDSTLSIPSLIWLKTRTVERSLISSWNVVWYVCAGFSAAGVLVYWAFATCEEQQWHKDMVSRVCRSKERNFAILLLFVSINQLFSFRKNNRIYQIQHFKSPIRSSQLLR